MDTDKIDSTFLHSKIDDLCRDVWADHGKLFPADPDAPTFKMILPPPNITGTLHLGHALNITIQDVITRYHRLKGDNVVWIPGVDHAGIATQVVVEKQLMNDENRSRHDLGRDEFLKRVWLWKEKNSLTISKQIQELCPLINYELEQFTMSSELSNAVRDAFIKLYEKGLIYRDLRMVDYCCHLKTVISNIEVEELEVLEPTKFTTPDSIKVDLGLMYDIKYEIDSDKSNVKFITVSTTRPETLFGDVAVAVNPNDPKYKGLENTMLKLPLTDRKIPLIYDDQVKMDLGTGAVKITPAHDPKDYQCLSKFKSINSLSDPIEVIDDDGLMNLPNTVFHKKHRYICRKLVLKQLEEDGLLVQTRNHKTTVRLCSRSKDILEPKLKHQWYIDTSDMCQRSIDSVENGDLILEPDSDLNKATWKRFLSEGRSWCISRQLWFGHRIPAYRVHSDSVCSEEWSEKWIVANSLEEAQSKAELLYPNLNFTLKQDEDVLDTWFSSGLYPFSILKGQYFPLDILETGKDILFFWVARMVMLSLAIKNELPFKKVYLHNIVRDKEGKKMSKSLGNIIDPLDVIYGIKRIDMENRIKNSNLDEKEISRAVQNIKRNFPSGISDYGVDSLRMGLIYYLRQSTDINLDPTIFKTSHALLNKLWNVMMMYRFYQNSLINYKDINETNLELDKSLNADSKLVLLLDTVNTYMHKLEKKYLNMAYYETNDFGAVYDSFQQYVMNHFCPFYLEFIKYFLTNQSYDFIRKQILQTMLEYFINILLYIHPVAPNATHVMYSILTDKHIITAKPFLHSKSDDYSTEIVELIRKSIHEKNLNPDIEEYSDIIRFMIKN